MNALRYHFIPFLSQFFKNKGLLLLQVPATLFILAFVPGTILKLVALLILWILTFKKLEEREWVLFVFINIFFTIFNNLALKNGIFTFNAVDIFRLPAYEFFMWGFYALHTKRMLQGDVPRKKIWLVFVLAFLYILTFSFIKDTSLLFTVSSILLIASLFFFHEVMDFVYVGYFVALGTLIEYTGVLSGLWYYVDSIYGGVPFWFITLWGGVGFFLRRLVLPILQEDGNNVAKKSV